MGNQLLEFVDEHRDPKMSQFASPTVYDAIFDAQFRSNSRLYSWREVAMDYLPCLMTIHDVYQSMCKTRPSYQRRMQHPFDAVDMRTGAMIDFHGNLKHTIQSYRFASGR